MTMTVATNTLPWVALLLLVATAEASSSPSFHTNKNIGQFGGFNSLSSSRIQQLERFRGGAIADDYDDYDEYDSDDEEEAVSEPIVTKTKKLATATKIATAKKTAQRTAVTKAKVSAAMAKSPAKKTTKSPLGWYKRTVPYIIRACLNPFTLVAMTKAYFVSLMDINYLKEEPTQNLRSALEEKARKQPGAGQTEPKRKMKPGQAKTLSDLPQLSA